MAKVRVLLTPDEKYELVMLFYEYPNQRLVELLQEEESYIEDRHLPYIAYLESVLHTSLLKAADNYNKGSEYSKNKRPLYFKKSLDKISKNDLASATLKINAALSRMNGSASRKPLKSDKALYKKLQLIKEGKDLLELKLEEIENN